MSKKVLVLLSFLAGACFATFLCRQPHEVHAQIMEGFTIDAAGIDKMAVMVDPAAVPVVNPINPAFLPTSIGIANTVAQPLDGLKCDGCSFTDAGLTYGGGAFDLKNASFSGSTKLQLIGAAANTVALLELVKGIEIDGPITSLPFAKPVEKIAKTPKLRTKLNFQVPFNGVNLLGPAK